MYEDRQAYRRTRLKTLSLLTALRKLVSKRKHCVVVHTAVAVGGSRCPTATMAIVQNLRFALNLIIGI